MATMKVKGGFKVKKKDGTLGKTVFKTQKAAQARARGPGKKGRKAPARRKSTARKAPARKRSKSVAKKGNPNRAPKMGAVLKGARAVDTISGPAQGVAIREGATPQALIARYDNRAALETSVKGGAVGLVRNVITSKSGAYRGVSQNKILSYVQVLAPEITAAGKANPLSDPKGFNDFRHIAHEGYDPAQHRFDAGFAALRESALLQGVAWGAQKVAQKLGINKMLPKGVNL